MSLQPWAQLLVLGIKRIEGRGWPSSHRGTLWIHATAQHPSANTVQASPFTVDPSPMLGSCDQPSAASHETLFLQELKDFFQEVHGQHEISFPEQLPVSALVGCVTVVDVLTVCFHLPFGCAAASSSITNPSGVAQHCKDKPRSGCARAAACCHDALLEYSSRHHTGQHLQAEQVAAWDQLPDALKLEVGSPQAFLCEDPMVLARPISMRGSPKMWQLPPQLLARARAALQPPPQVNAPASCCRRTHLSVLW